LQYSPFTYDAMNVVISAMQKADSVDPAKFVPAIFSGEFMGSSGKIAFDAKGDRKDAEMTIFTLKAGKVEPITVVKGGKSMTLDEAQKLTAEAPAAGAAPAPTAAAAPAAGGAAPAPAGAAAPAADAKPGMADKAKEAAGAAVDKAKEAGKDMAKEAVKAGVEAAKEAVKK
jgi:hypothetical protein